MEKKPSITSKASRKIIEKEFDLMKNLKNNIKTATRECEIHESVHTSYCLQCMQAICDVCQTTVHNGHYYILKSDYPFDYNFYSKLLTDFESKVSGVEELIHPSELIKSQKEAIEKEMEDIIIKVKDLKEKRVKELNLMFDSNNIDFSKMKESVKKTKETLKNFFIKYKSFYQNQSAPPTEDEDNFLFLKNYDLVTDCNKNIQHYLFIINQIKANYQNLSEISNTRYTDLLRMIESLLMDQKKKEIKNANSKIWNIIEPTSANTNKKKSDKRVRKVSNTGLDSNHSSSTNVTCPALFELYAKLSEDHFAELRGKVDSLDSFNENFKSQIFDSVKKNQSLSEVAQLVKISEEKLAKRVNITGHNRKISVNKSMKSKTKIGSSKDFSNSSSKSRSNSVNQDRQTVQKQRSKTSDKSKGSLDGNKKSLFSNKKRNSILEEKMRIEIQEKIDNENDESINDTIDEAERINVDLKFNKVVDDNRTNLYSQVDKVFKPINKIKSASKTINPKNKEMLKEPNSKKDKFKINQELADRAVESEKIMKQYCTKDKINLSNLTIRKYYSFMYIEYLRIILSKSDPRNNDILIFELYDKSVSEESKYKHITVRVIEGSDEIHLYHNNTKKIEKIKVNLEENRGLKIKNFYIGCRWILIQGKIYICGGKDTCGDKKLCFVYNIHDKKLLKLGNLKYPRSFHTMIYHENMRSIICLGGENNNTCEMYDFYLNTWNDLPELNYPRANLTFVTNTTGTLAYAMFGIIGDIVNKKLTEVIEVIDMIDMNKGWYKIDYSNKTGIDLKTKELKVYLLPSNKFLIFGGFESRIQIPKYLLFDLRTLEMTKIDGLQAEMLKQTAIEENH